MRTIVARFYLRLMILGVLFGCESQQKEFPYQDVSERETEEIHELINQLVDEKENDKWKYLFSIQLVIY